MTYRDSVARLCLQRAYFNSFLCINYVSPVRIAGGARSMFKIRLVPPKLLIFSHGQEKVPAFLILLLFKE